MKNGTHKSLLSLAKAAFQRASEGVVQIAEATGTPVIIWEDGAVREVDPQEMRRRLAAKKPKKAASGARKASKPAPKRKGSK